MLMVGNQSITADGTPNDATVQPLWYKGNTVGMDPTGNRPEQIMESILNALNENDPVSVNALQKVTGMSATALALALVGLGGKVAVKDGGLVIAPEPVKEKVPTGPRGPTAKVLPRLEACRSKFLEAAARPEGVTAKELLAESGEAYVYTDILLVARHLTEAGLIEESRKGRKATWNSTTNG
jgi:hypothetical protein